MTDAPELGHGWKTHIDGTRTSLTKSEADEIRQFIQESKVRQAALYPTTHDALRAHIDADERMRALGWRKSIFPLQDGDELAVCEWGSAGVFHAIWHKPYLHYQDCVAAMGKHFLKRLEDLSEDERSMMDRCTAEHAAFMEHFTERMAAASDALHFGKPTP